MDVKDIKQMLLDEESALIESRSLGGDSDLEQTRKVNDMVIALEKAEAEKAESAAKIAALEAEQKDRLKDRLVKVGLGVLQIGTYVLGMRMAFKFEETGSITSTAGRSNMKNLFDLSKLKL